MQTWKKVGAVLAASGFLAACSGGGGGGGTPSAERSVSVKGQFDPTQLPQNAVLAKLLNFSSLGIQPMAMSHEIHCQTLSIPSTSSSALVGAAGDFSLTIAVPEGQALGCFLVTKNNTVPMSWVAMVFQSQASVTGNGNLAQGGYPLSSDATELNFGSIAVTTNPNGTITVSAPNASDNGQVALPAFADMTGEWNVLSIPTGNGNVHPCDMDNLDAARKAECKTAWQATPVYIHTFTADNAGEKRSNISLWQNKAAFDACGTEGVTLTPPWTTTDTKVTPAVPNHHGSEVDWMSPSSATLTAAKFRISYGDNTSSPETDNNCPFTRVRNGSGGFEDSIADAAGKNAYQQCQAARTCADFNYKNDEFGAKARAACLIESLSNRSDDGGYSWNSTGTLRCGKQMNLSWTVQDDVLEDITTAAGCNSADCGGIINNSAFLNAPKFRRFIGELFATGNLGTGTSTELDKHKRWDSGGGTSFFCNMHRELSFQITQNSATSAVFALTMNVYPQSGTITGADVGAGENDPELDDVGQVWFDSDKCMDFDWVRNELSAPIKIKMVLQKK